MELKDYIANNPEPEQPAPAKKERKKFKLAEATPPANASNPISEMSNEEAVSFATNLTNMAFHLFKFRPVEDDLFAGVEDATGNVVRTIMKQLGGDFKIYFDVAIVGGVIISAYSQRKDEKKLEDKNTVEVKNDDKQ